MGTTLMKFTGKAKWAKVFEENRDMKGYNDATGQFDLPSPVNGRYSIDVTLTDAEYKILKKSGSFAAKSSKYDEDGNDVVKFGRDHEKKNFKGEIMDFASGPPKVVKFDGSEWSMEDDGDIGNDSTVEVSVSVYTTKYNPGTRLEKVRVIDHVVYDASGSPDDTLADESEEEVPF